jgi:hypothetical protein
MGTGGPFPGGKARPGRDADHSPPSSAEVKNEEELYLPPPQTPLWRVAGQPTLLPHVFPEQDEFKNLKKQIGPYCLRNLCLLYFVFLVSVNRNTHS